MAELETVVQIGHWRYEVIYGQLSTLEPATTDIIRLEPLLHNLLNYFLSQPNIVLSKDTLLEQVWPIDAGSDAAVMRAVGALRKVLGDDVKAPLFIATVPKKGYCWLAEITSSPLPVEPIITVSQPSPDVANLCITSHNSTIVHKSDNTPNANDKNTDFVWSWRFIAFTTLFLILSSASLAFVLSLFTTEPLLKLPNAITPISALNGEEYFPILNLEQTQVIYQHRNIDENVLVWVQQDLESRRAHFLSQQYLALSAAQWQDQQHIIFSGQTESEACGVYQQQFYPVVADATLLWPCHKLLTVAPIKWQQQWLWLDISTGDNNKRLELWSGKLAEHKSGQQKQPAQLLAAYDFNWHSVSAMLLQQDQLLLLVNETASNTVLLNINLLTTNISVVQRFTRTLTGMAWWDKSSLLLSGFNQHLKVYDLVAKTEQDLGPLTRSLTQAVRYPGQVLASQYLNYTSDIYQVEMLGEQEWQITPWHISNKNEYLLAVNGTMRAFISERSGVSQVWLQHGSGYNFQLTDFAQQQQIQQLFWHQQQLMLVANNQLFQIDIETGAVQLAQQQVAIIGRYASCQQQLFWTELTSAGWQLLTATDQGVELVYNGVRDVRCGIEQQLVVQQVANDQLAILALSNNKAELIENLPIKIDWRTVSSEQWFVDSSGIYWLNPAEKNVQSYLWQSQEVKAELAIATNTLKPVATTSLATRQEQSWPLAIYSKGNGLGYMVQARPFDTDIVWLQHRR